MQLETQESERPALELKNVYKSFPGVKALQDMSFQLRQGEVHALLGENGAGKSTLIKVVAGVHKPDGGEILIRGKNVTFASPADSIKAGIGVVYQEISAFSNLSIAENMFVGRLPKKAHSMSVDFKRVRKEAREVYELLQVDADVDMPVEKLGIADKQMLEIAKAISMDSRILILDEPTAALSGKEVDSLFRVINHLKKNGVSMIFISHRLEEVFTIADRVTVMRDGQFIGTKDVKQVDTAELVRMMVGRNVDSFYPKSDVKIGETVLEVEHLSDGGLVRDVSFELHRGEILGISGLAGAGRTELATALTGLRKKTGGEIRLNGRKVSIRNYKDALAKGIVYVSEDRQQFGLTLPMSVKDNASLAGLLQLCKLGFIRKKDEIKNANSLISQLRIACPHYNFAVANLSGGNQQKVSVAKALSSKDPQILIFDEPTRGVDVGSKAEIHALISSMVERGLSIIMISSDMPEIIGMSDRVLVLREGCVAGVVDRKTMDQERILALALGTLAEEKSV